MFKSIKSYIIICGASIGAASAVGLRGSSDTMSSFLQPAPSLHPLMSPQHPDVSSLVAQGFPESAVQVALLASSGNVTQARAMLQAPHARQREKFGLDPKTLVC